MLRRYTLLIFQLLRKSVHFLPLPLFFWTFSSLFYRIIRGFFRDDGTHMAAGVAYYAVFSLFPLMLGSIALAGFFFDSTEAQKPLIDFASEQIPGASNLIRDNLEGLVQARGTIGIVSIVGLFWSGRAVLGAVHRVINRAWGVQDPSHFWVQQLSQLGVAIGVGTVFILSVALGIAGRIITGTDLANDSFLFQFGWRLLVNTLPLLLGIGLFGYMYRYVTDVKVTWKTALPGAILAGVLFEFAKLGFVIYIDNFSSFDRVYGGISAVIVLMVWFYVVSIILVIGAETSSEFNKAKLSGELILRDQLKFRKFGARLNRFQKRQ